MTDQDQTAVHEHEHVSVHVYVYVNGDSERRIADSADQVSTPIDRGSHPACRTLEPFSTTPCDSDSTICPRFLKRT